MMIHEDSSTSLPVNNESAVDFSLSQLKRQREEYPEFDEMPHSERSAFMARILNLREQYQINEGSIAEAVGISIDDMMLIASEIDERLEN